MARFERVFLYVVVLALALVVAFLAFETECRWKDGCQQTAEGEDPWTKLNELLAAIASDLGKALEMEESQAELVRSELKRGAPRIADLVYAKLRQEGVCLAPAGRCGEVPPAPVAANHTFLYDDARLNDARQITADSFGVRLAPRHNRRLDRLERAFGACQRDGAEVVFAVTGYSSTAEFREETPEGDRRPLDQSNALNLATANLRAQVVAARLEAAGFTVAATEWKSFEALQRPYLDAPDDSQPDDSQALNRSVFIEVRHAGACDLGRLVPPN